MRARQPETTRDNACSRCAALLRPDAARCGLCGWTAGLPYPEPELELELEPEPEPQAEVADAAEATTDESTTDEPTTDEDARADEDENADDARPASLDPVAAAQLETLDRLADAPPRDEAPLAQLDLAAPDAVEVQAAAGDVADPLTAPLSSLTSAGSTMTAGGSVAPVEGGMVTTLLLETGERAAAAATPVQSTTKESSTDDQLPEPSEENRGDLVDGQVIDHDDDEQSKPVFTPVSKLGQGVAMLTVLVGVLALVVPLLNSFLVPDTVTTMLDVVVTLVPGLLLIALFGSSASLFLAWVSRARTNVEVRSSVRQRWGRPWALFGWLIPVAGLFIGWQVLQDLWAASDPTTRDEEDGRPPEPPLITGWLAGLVVWSVIWLIGTVILGGSPLVEVVAGLALIASALCLARTVQQISSWQDAA